MITDTVANAIDQRLLKTNTKNESFPLIYVLQSLEFVVFFSIGDVLVIDNSRRDIGNDGVQDYKYSTFRQ